LEAYYWITSPFLDLSELWLSTQLSCSGSNSTPSWLYILHIFLNYISNAIPKVPHTLPPQGTSSPIPSLLQPWGASKVALVGPWSGAVPFQPLPLESGMITQGSVEKHPAVSSRPPAQSTGTLAGHGIFFLSTFSPGPLGLPLFSSQQWGP
jgi:hypothetical protein